MTDNPELPPVPKVGDTIYVPTALYISHGEDDVRGGLAEVTRVVEEQHGKRTVHGIVVKEVPGTKYYWENGLAQQQNKLQERHGGRRAKPDPDERPEFRSDGPNDRW